MGWSERVSGVLAFSCHVKDGEPGPFRRLEEDVQSVASVCRGGEGRGDRRGEGTCVSAPWSVCSVERGLDFISMQGEDH